jgi:hypothetical protein
VFVELQLDIFVMFSFYGSTCHEEMSLPIVLPVKTPTESSHLRAYVHRDGTQYAQTTQLNYPFHIFVTDILSRYASHRINEQECPSRVTSLMRKAGFACFGHYWPSSGGTANTTKKYFTCMLNTGCRKGTFTIRNRH